jgi:hypothetical protein
LEKNMLSILLETVGALGALLSIAARLGDWRGNTISGDDPTD